MDKNTVIGFVLIGVVLFLFTWLNRPSPEQLEAQQRYRDSIALIESAQRMEQQVLESRKMQEEQSLETLPDSLKEVQLQNTFGAFAAAINGTEESIQLENEKLEIRLSSKGGRLEYARLKEYVTHDSLPLVLFQGKESRLDFTLVTATNRVINTSELYFTPIKGNTPNSVTMRLNVEGGAYLDFIYTLRPDDYMLDYTIQGHGLNGLLSPSTNTLDMLWEQDIRQQEKGRKYEDQHTALYYRFMTNDVEKLSEVKDQSEKVSNRLKWVAYKDKFFASVLISKDGFEATTLDSKLFTTTTNYLKHFKTLTAIPFDLQGKEPTELTYYLGPTHYAMLKSYDKGVASGEELDLERLVPMGGSVFRFLNKYFIIPIFDFLGKFFSNYGLLIFLLTLIVKLVLFPLTYKSYMSSAKMRVLRPQVEAINAKYPGQEKAMERQKATMDLYSKAGASPMSGCLPMLLQFPILVALYNFFPSAIELRQESFLWAKDLSTYDAVFSWNTYIPIISTYFGNHISLFCLLMTLVNVVYTKFNMEMTNTGQQQMPGMKMMMYMMPLMFLVFFNQSPAALSYYFLVSTLITIGQTLSFRFLINEEKLLAKLEENKKKPKKKSGFMKRLEEAQKQQQEVLKKQQQQQRKKK
ncbi:YidC/Oxa1 family membrane protein insertase [Parabacteroides sp. PF5-5]|uniref:membrane protein insertase YidC n=1 Tax=unclassified Parabacteroides TaxID=2649774 RepID=UPI0024731F67|nr:MULTISPECIES: membrane protein insertase YidC [unclassified Parabacteroides]MDH6304496.1 YidC/Oxa1 family membrane protein insertase [Parabacteroides sp. PH5-39]MDH6315351.1 YidC/Oxa1 family membrane protein insertase [Parabacteroides sp. PF5-13]MDH6319155.1 YidC/Oxa1 family membrane protein insertase [Parabacteroides sp. PH5-13]MDH6322885.1 YidC/Oxa1 family membrane protein insertase [Parabacteroides sp. PH5-8]MDH6326543.1 YidC/Oxa1 family membrane protein insertase [Parabacteroides sp. PH